MSGQPAYPHLAAPITIGGVAVRNRIMQTGHSKQFSYDGVDSRRDLSYLVERARGGIGLMITGNRFVHPTSSAGAPRFAWGFLAKAVAADRRITTAVHEHGAVIFAQLNHFGVNGSSENVDDLRVLLGPSAIASPMYNEVPKAMDAGDIERVTEGWARSAELSREAGFDGIEVHLAHAYLLHQFLSPLYNQRTDEYGGSLANRLRFAGAVIARVRARVGGDYPISVRISLGDMVGGGMTLEDAVEITRWLRVAGRADLITVTAGGYHDGLYNAIATSDRGDGWLIEPTAQVKKVAGDIPVCVVGGIQDPAQAEQVLAADQADMVALTRAQIADPDWANKVLGGRETELRRCIRSNQGCISRSFRGFPIGCTVNPAAGREALLGAGTLVPATPPRRWLVAGGGPAGLKAAEVLARRGHQVSLWERSGELGGQVSLLARSPGRARFGYLIEDLQRSLERLGVDVRLGVTATADLVAADQPDAVIVATGAEPDDSGFSSIAPLVPRIPRAGGGEVLTGWDVLSGARQPRGRHVLLLDDLGTRYSAGVAETLLDQGFDVEFVTRLPALLPSLDTTLDLGEVYTRLMTKGMRYQVNRWARAIEPDAVRLFDVFTEQESTARPVSSVVLATSPRSNARLHAGLAGQVAELHLIGDALAPRRLDHAIYEGEMTGRELFSDDRYIVEGDLERFLPADG
jgi:2,4-dienoyl-CoA reductase-like NADH-dependent reductase (Old Yellow Enzyme family)